MNPTRLPAFKYYLPFIFFLLLIGWGGLFIVIRLTLPTLGPRWFFYFFLVLGLTGLGLPLVYFLNFRFPSNPPIDSSVIIRQSSWVGVYGALVAWLQTGRILTPALGVVLAVGFIIIEGLIRMRERSKWKPEPPPDKPAATSTIIPTEEK